MTGLSSQINARRGRIFPENTISPEELARRKDERNKRGQRCREIFEKIYPELKENKANWFVVIEPNSGDYFLDLDENIAMEKARQKYANMWMVIFQVNETGTCGKI
ncbi:hypothetical protein [Oscillatoria salina]|uniref:hypothetical protein n=1 Tax=Oscillatoria salina TaxID=331517 RepID=UPI0013BB8D39|nr:hypothetical protein [Oscillatoria salina]MBZ8183226.1 hypothetical protein [Oscillatoria salina IIICB1]NET88557.1 hypothetical protein [Kamptonema sp. SIO1D9]